MTEPWTLSPETAEDLRRQAEELVNGATEIPDIPDIPRDRACRQSFSPLPAPLLAARETEEIEWIVPDYVPPGGLVLLVAPPKTGKSTFGYHMAHAVSSGQRFLGRVVKKTRVLILALEEREEDVKRRIKALGMGEDVYFHVGPLRADALPLIEHYIREHDIGMMIVDTLPRFWTVDDENNAVQVGAAISPILDLARSTNAAVVLIHHSRKSVGKHGADIRGSGDLFAHCDLAMIMRHASGANQRELESFSRYDSTPDKLMISLEEDGYHVLGDAASVKAQESDDLYLSFLTAEAMTVEQIKEQSDLDESERTLSRRYEKMLDKGLCQREGSGKKSDPFRYKMIDDSTNL